MQPNSPLYPKIHINTSKERFGPIMSAYRDLGQHKENSARQHERAVDTIFSYFHRKHSVEAFQYFSNNIICKIAA